MALFGRKIKVELLSEDTGEALYEVEDLKIEIDINSPGTDTPTRGFVRIYNISAIRAVHLSKQVYDGLEIRISVGYGTVLRELFWGAIRRIIRERSDLDYIVTIHVEPFTRALKRLTDKSFGGAVDTITILEWLEDFTGLTFVGYNMLIPAPIGRRNNPYLDGPAGDEIAKALEPHSLKPSLVGKQVVFLAEDEYNPDLPELRLSATSGLIGIPSLNDPYTEYHKEDIERDLADAPEGHREGAELTVTMLMNPLCRIGTPLKVEMSERDNRAIAIINREWQVLTVRHHGDNRDGDFITTVDCKELRSGRGISRGGRDGPRDRGGGGRRDRGG